MVLIVEQNYKRTHTNGERAYLHSPTAAERLQGFMPQTEQHALSNTILKEMNNWRVQMCQVLLNRSSLDPTDTTTYTL